MGNRATSGFFSSVSSSSASSSSIAYESCREDDASLPSKFLNDEVLNHSIRRNNMIRPSINVNINNSSEDYIQHDDMSSSNNSSSSRSENKYRISSSSSPPKSILKSSISSLPSAASLTQLSRVHNQNLVHQTQPQHQKGHAHNNGVASNENFKTEQKRSIRSMSITSEDGYAYMLPLSSASPNASRSPNGNRSPKNRVHPMNASFQQDSLSSPSLMNNFYQKPTETLIRDSIFEENSNHVDLARFRSNSLPVNSWNLDRNVDTRNLIILHSPQKRIPQNIVNLEPTMVVDTPIVCLTLPNEPPVHHHLHAKRPKKDLKKKKKKLSRKN